MTNNAAPSQTRSRLVTGALVLLAVVAVVLVLMPGLAMIGLYLLFTMGGGQIG